MRNSLLTYGAVSLLLIAGGCRFPYTFRNGGGLDSNLRTVAVLPFENKTTTPGLEREIQELLSTEMRKLGLREAPERSAHVLVTGVIARYEVDIPVAFSADPRSAAGTRRKLEVSVEVSITAQEQGKVLFRRTVSAPGEYAESAEQAGRRDAFTKLVNDIVQGVQSQW
jgi:hypothetical protein